MVKPWDDEGGSGPLLSALETRTNRRHALRPRQPRCGRRRRVRRARRKAEATLSRLAGRLRLSGVRTPVIRDGPRPAGGRGRATDPRRARHAVRRRPRQERHSLRAQHLPGWPARPDDRIWPRARPRPEDAARRGRAHPRGARSGQATDVPLHETLLVVVGRGASDPDANSNVAKVTRMLWEGFGFGWAETAYSGVTFPLVEPALEKAARLGFRRIVVFPYFLFTGILVAAHLRRDGRGRRAPSRRSSSSRRPTSTTIRWCSTPSSSGSARSSTGDNLMNCQLCKYRDADPRLRGGGRPAAGEPSPSCGGHRHGRPPSPRGRRWPRRGRMRSCNGEEQAKTRTPQPLTRPHSRGTLSLWERGNAGAAPTVLSYRPVHTHAHGHAHTHDSPPCHDHDHPHDHHHPPLPARRPPARPALAEEGLTMLDYIRDPAEITRRSFAIIAKETELASLPEDIRAVAARIVHACGMPDIVGDLAFSEGAGATGRAALAPARRSSATCAWSPPGSQTKRLPRSNPVHVALDEPGAAELAAALRPNAHRRGNGARSTAPRWLRSS